MMVVTTIILGVQATERCVFRKSNTNGIVICDIGSICDSGNTGYTEYHSQPQKGESYHFGSVSQTGAWLQSPAQYL